MKHQYVYKTAFNTKYGKFEYIVVPRGAWTGPATLPTLLNQIFHDFFHDFLVVYSEDLVLSRKDELTNYLPL